MITAEIITDSVSPAGVRLTTFRLVYPRFIHSEVMTHRVFSRNAASSRAIPFAKMAETVLTNPAMPVKWGSHQKGMQSGDEIVETNHAVSIWHSACEEAVYHAQKLDTLGVHKSITNRLLEPFAHMTTVVTATDWHNFFVLRAHKDAQPEFQDLAYKMLRLYLTQLPTPVLANHWHLPFVSVAEQQEYGWEGGLRPVAVARCARTSYANFKESTFGEDKAMHDRLAGNGHWSPFEHVARPLEDPTVYSGNFRGWHQYRKDFVDENRTNVNLHQILLDVL
jgi:thymidylate synthase ThyX